MALYKLPFPSVPLFHIFSRQKHKLCKFFLGQLLQLFRCALRNLPYLCFHVGQGGVYGFFVLCKLRPQRRLFLFPLALFVGMTMKSSKATIISSFLLILLTQANIGDFSLAGSTIFPSILMIISFMFAGLSICNVERKDLM